MAISFVKIICRKNINELPRLDAAALRGFGLATLSVY